MAPQRQKRTKRKLPTRNIVDAEFVSSSASARVLDDLLLPSNHDRAILSQLWDNQETTRSELPHVAVTSTRRRLVQPSTNTVQQTYLQRLQEKTKDTTDLSAQSIIPIALVNNMNTRATAAAAGSDSEEEAEETYTNLAPLSQQVGMGTEQDFSHGVSNDPFSQNNTGVSPDETDQLQLSLNVLQVTHIDSLHKKDTLHNENDIPENLLLEESHVTELMELEPDHSNVPMVVKHDSAVNDQAPVSMSQAVMMEYEGMVEAERVNENRMMELEIVIEKAYVNEKDDIVDTVNEKDDCVNNVDKRDGPKEGEVIEAIEEGMEEYEAVEANEEEAVEEAFAEVAKEGAGEDEKEFVEASEASEEEAGEAIEEEFVGASEASEEEAGEAIEEEAGEAVEKEAGEAIKKEFVEALEEDASEAIEAIEEGFVEALEKEFVEAIEEETGEAIEEEAGEAIEAEFVEALEEEFVEAIEAEVDETIEEAVEEEEASEAIEEAVDEIMEEAVETMKEVFEEEPVENQVNKEKVLVETNHPSYDVDEEIIIRLRSVEPTPCMFFTIAKPLQIDDDLVLIKQEPLDESEYDLAAEEVTNNDVSCHSDKSMNDVSCHLDEHTNDVTSCPSQEFTEPAVSDPSVEAASTAVPEYSDEVANTAVFDPYVEAAKAAVSDPNVEAANSAVPDYSDEVGCTTVSDHSDEVSNTGISDHYVEIVNTATSYYSRENTNTSTSDRSDNKMNNTISCTSDEFMRNVVSHHSDNYISEEEALSLQVLYEEPSPCLYRMSVSLEREDGLVPIKQEPVDDLEMLESLISQHDLGVHLPVNTDVVVKQEPAEDSADKEYDPMEIEYECPDLQDNPEVSDMEEVEYSDEVDEAETEQDDTDDGMLMVEVKKSSSVKPQDCYILIESLAGPEVAEEEAVDSPSGSGSGSSIGDDDWMTAEDLNGDDDDQEVVYKNIFDVMSMAKDIESKPIMTKPGQKKGQKRLRPNDWIEDNKNTIVLTNVQEERVLKRRRKLEARLEKPFIIKKKMKCVWLVEADTASK